MRYPHFIMIVKWVPPVVFTRPTPIEEHVHTLGPNQVVVTQLLVAEGARARRREAGHVGPSMEPPVVKISRICNGSPEGLCKDRIVVGIRDAGRILSRRGILCDAGLVKTYVKRSPSHDDPIGWLPVCPSNGSLVGIKPPDTWRYVKRLKPRPLPKVDSIVRCAGGRTIGPIKED